MTLFSANDFEWQVPKNYLENLIQKLKSVSLIVTQLHAKSKSHWDVSPAYNKFR